MWNFVVIERRCGRILKKERYVSHQNSIAARNYNNGEEREDKGKYLID